MQREIKFRAWVKSENKLYPVEQWSNNSWIAVPVQLSEDDWQLEQRPMEDVILMQFTGLKDKNGKDIYEGDIVKYQASLIPLVEEVYVCIWYQNGFGYKKPGEDDQASMYLQQSKLEVIGNIHENPALLSNPQ